VILPQDWIPAPRPVAGGSRGGGNDWPVIPPESNGWHEKAGRFPARLSRKGDWRVYFVVELGVVVLLPVPLGLPMRLPVDVPAPLLVELLALLAFVVPLCAKVL
jgi:hypothetical protein